MNILILSWRGPKSPRAGGAELVTHEYAKGWVEAGHRVTLFTSFFPGAKENEIIDGVEIIRRGGEVFSVQVRAFWWYLFGDHSKFDLVVDQFHGVPFFTPLFVRVKKLAFIHEVASEVWKLNPWPKPFNLIPFVVGTLFEPLVFKLLYAQIPFLTVSNSTKKELLAWGVKKVSVIENGIDVPKLTRQPAKNNQPTITFLGALSRDKGIEEAIKVFKELEERHPKHFLFWIIGKGEGSFMNHLKKVIKKDGLEKRLKLWGYVDTLTKFELVAKSHLLINPSVKEGWGLVVIEGAAMGTPTVAFNVAGLRDSIVNNKTGVLCSEKTVESMTQSIVDLLEDKNRYSKMRDNAKEWSAHFSWTRSIKQSLKLIENL